MEYVLFGKVTVTLSSQTLAARRERAAAESVHQHFLHHLVHPALWCYRYTQLENTPYKLSKNLKILEYIDKTSIYHATKLHIRIQTTDRETKIANSAMVCLLWSSSWESNCQLKFCHGRWCFFGYFFTTFRWVFRARVHHAPDTSWDESSVQGRWTLLHGALMLVAVVGARGCCQAHGHARVQISLGSLPLLGKVSAYSRFVLPATFHLKMLSCWTGWPWFSATSCWSYLVSCSTYSACSCSCSKSSTRPVHNFLIYSNRYAYVPRLNLLSSLV